MYKDILCAVTKCLSVWKNRIHFMFLTNDAEVFLPLFPRPLPSAVEAESGRFVAQAEPGHKFCSACWRTVCRSRSEPRSTSKLEHSEATHSKWVLMSSPAFIFCTVRHPYGSTKMSAGPAGANILQPPWWHCHQSFTSTQVIACSRHICICAWACARGGWLAVYTRRYKVSVSNLW